MKTLFVFFILLFSSNLFAAKKLGNSCDLKNDQVEIEVEAIKKYLETCVIPVFKEKGFFNSDMDLINLDVVVKPAERPEILGKYSYGYKGRISNKFLEKNVLTIFVHHDLQTVSASTLIHEMAHGWDITDKELHRREHEVNVHVNSLCNIDETVSKVDKGRWTVEGNTNMNLSASRPSVYSNKNDLELIAETITAILLDDSWATKENVDLVLNARNSCKEQEIKKEADRKAALDREIREQIKAMNEARAKGLKHYFWRGETLPLP